MGLVVKAARGLLLPYVRAPRPERALLLPATVSSLSVFYRNERRKLFRSSPFAGMVVFYSEASDCRDEDDMTDGTRHQRMKELPPPWPVDRYEVLCKRSAPYAGTRDQYHFAEFAVESARALEEAGLATRVAVIRLADDTIIYDPVAGVELPPAQW
ncbi:hypothetical protein ACTMTI_34115 [Nonomuraea sp. H19]|uniref:hypothetical protein n=1 Tax=Nonomuraea sp. H19 TaxID=3452206 RepID=UPI003F89F2E7